MIARGCRILSYTLEPEDAPTFTPSKVPGGLEITGRLVEMKSVWEFRVSPFIAYQPLALPTPLEEQQGVDDLELDHDGSGDFGLRFEWPFVDPPSSKSGGNGQTSFVWDCQWTQGLHGTVSRGSFRVLAVLMVYGVVEYPSLY